MSKNKGIINNGKIGGDVTIKSIKKHVGDNIKLTVRPF